ncbi:hypothetical protein HS1_000933 [Candidatus Desulfofervidus auxilii]|uniref:Cyclodipeptide synthase n=1 Tax=Desulfofervidus auxilii TaxID=1621989 RepID=A0A7U4QJY1_DESA2|nr:hypothetical protein [Candidatus Desulfofervidus auxilii]AMM40737.1 hypothetical protein HS1_000933 [Candidatus Desulfofervidus auxilii]CAD7774280.1 hypothetical protein BLFGPEAP_01086 [Candidatus Methanoperedenaceae archaeon GB50]CAD7775592.1 hypothetical protein DMNBHIDG_01152 [Candidatus Methanoperedenaceae archaeon GB37]
MPIYSISEAPKGHYFMGISLMSNVLFSKRTVRQYYNALGEKALSFLVIIADSLEMWNYAYFKGLSLSEARQKSLLVGKQYQSGYLKLSKLLPNFYVSLASEIETHDAWKRIYEILRNFYSENELFQKAVKLQIVENIGSKLKCRDVNGVPDLITNYILEEIAITVGIYSGILMEQRIQISPQLDNLLVDLYNGKFPELSHNLKIKSSELQYVVYNPKAKEEQL